MFTLLSRQTFVCIFTMNKEKRKLLLRLMVTTDLQFMANELDKLASVGIKVTLVSRSILIRAQGGEQVTITIVRGAVVIDSACSGCHVGGRTALLCSAPATSILPQPASSIQAKSLLQIKLTSILVST